MRKLDLFLYRAAGAMAAVVIVGGVSAIALLWWRGRDARQCASLGGISLDSNARGPERAD